MDPIIPPPNPPAAPKPPPQPAPAPVPVPLPSTPPASPSAHVDLTKILLPKKEGAPSVDSAQRINAGVLFEQEQKAELPTPIKPEVAPIAPPKKDDTSLVRPLQTYQGDIESLVEDKNVSVVSIAAAEANRRGMSKLSNSQAPLNQDMGRPWLRKALMIAGGVALILAAVGGGYYIYLRAQPVSIALQSPAPFISVDDTKTVQIAAGDSRGSIMQALVKARDGVSLSLGLVERLQVVKPTAAGDGSLQEVGAPELLPILAPSVPQALLRTLGTQMLLGVHSYDQNQSFMILKADSYETAYAGMLAWEASMQADLSPLFNRMPAVRAQNNALPAAVAAAGAASTSPAPYPASTTPSAPPPSPAASPAPSTTTTPQTQTPQTQTPPTGIPASTFGTTTPQVPASTGTPAPTPATQFFQGNFLDQIVENRDTRAILNAQGDILLLWTFLDRSTIVVTTNDATLREVISRLSQASILSLPAK